VRPRLFWQPAFTGPRNDTLLHAPPMRTSVLIRSENHPPRCKQNFFHDCVAHADQSAPEHAPEILVFLLATAGTNSARPCMQDSCSITAFVHVANALRKFPGNVAEKTVPSTNRISFSARSQSLLSGFRDTYFWACAHTFFSFLS